MKLVLIAIIMNEQDKNMEWLGYECLLASLEMNGLEGEILEIVINETNKLTNDNKEFLRKYNWNDIDIVGVSPMITNTPLVNEIINEIKNYNRKLHITAGGACATFGIQEMFNCIQELDTIVYGEGEITFIELIKRITENQSIEGCKGTAFRSGNKIVINDSREVIRDMDSLPIPKRKMLKKGVTAQATIQTSRGCKGYCGFCIEARLDSIHNKKKNKWRGRSPQNIVDEIEYIKNEFNIDKFFVIDSSFEDSEDRNFERMKSIVDEIINRKLDIRYRCLMRAENITRIGFETIGRMKESGFYHVLIGVESGYQPTLQMFHKIASVKDSIIAVRMLDELNIDVSLGFIAIHPYVTVAEIEANINFFKETNMERKFYDMVNKLLIFRGTPIYDKISKDGLLKPEYSMFNPYEFIIRDSLAANICDVIFKILTELYERANLNHYKETVRLIKLELFGINKSNSLSALELKKQLFEIEDMIGKKVFEKFELIINKYKCAMDVNVNEIINLLIQEIKLGSKKCMGLLKNIYRIKLRRS